MKPFFSLCTTMAVMGLLSPLPAQDVTSKPAEASDGVKVGVGGRDGITISGGEAFITRNGATEKLTKDLVLPSGVTARPDGSVVLSDKSQANLKTTQILTLDGKVLDLPPNPNENPGDAAGIAAAAAAAGGAAGSQQINGGAMGADGRSARSNPRERPAGGGYVDVSGGGGVPTGFVNPDGTITQADGSTISNTGAITPGTGLNGATTNPDGSITASNGSQLAPGSEGTPTTLPNGNLSYPDGTVRAPNGSVVSSPSGSQAGTQAQNGQSTQNGQTPSQTGNQMLNSPNQAGATTTGNNTNSPANTGTVNNGNTNPGIPSNSSNTQPTQTNNGVTTGNPNSAGRTNSSSSGSSTRSSSGSNSGSNGASGGARTGGAAGGAGGASGGAGGR